MILALDEFYMVRVGSLTDRQKINKNEKENKTGMMPKEQITAASHGRVFIVEIMGHKVGHLTLHAGIAGGADIILIPEIP